MPALNLYDLGDTTEVGYDYLNASGAHVNASAISAVQINPLGTQTALTPTRIATGQYVAVVGTFDVAGRWLARVTASGVVNDTETVAIMVRPAAPVRPDTSYATVDDVVRLAQGRTFTASSKPTVSDVQDWLNLTRSEIDGLLRRKGYDVPVATTATSALALLAHGNALGAAAYVESSAPTSKRYELARRLYNQFRESILAGDLELDAARDAEQSAPRSNADNQATAMFYTSGFRPIAGAMDW